MLEVVQHQQPRLFTQIIKKLLFRVAAGIELEVYGIGNCGHDELRRGERLKWYEVRLWKLLGSFEGEPCFANPAGANERQQPTGRINQQLIDFGQLVISAHKRRWKSRKVGCSHRKWAPCNLQIL